MSRIVIALGGNALQANGESSAQAQQEVAVATARQLVALVQAGHELIIAHGNGPQVGSILLNEEKSPHPAPLDTCGAMSQGEIGYWLQQAMANELRKQGIDKQVATIITQTVVDSQDPAFADPSKPVGQFYPDKTTAEQALLGRSAVVKEDAGRGWRRVVPSPRPKTIVEAAFIKNAVESGAIVIAAGGGGIPVVEQDAGQLVGIEAVIDKDFAAEKLAELVDADILLILTAVEAVSINYRKADEQALKTVAAQELQQYIAEGQFAPGSMLPKVQAALSFVEGNAGRYSLITTPEMATAAVDGAAGTRVSS